MYFSPLSFLETTTVLERRNSSPISPISFLRFVFFFSRLNPRTTKKERVFLLLLFCVGARTRTQTTRRVEVKHVVHAQTVPELRHLHHNERWPAHCRSLAWLRSTNKSYS